MKTKLRKILTAGSLCLMMAAGGAIISSQRVEALPGGGGGGGGGVSCLVCMADQSCPSSSWGYAEYCDYNSYGWCQARGSCY